MKTKKSIWMEICNTLTPICSLVVAFTEFFDGRFLSGIGWCSAAFAWWFLFKQDKIFDKITEMYLNHLDMFTQMSDEYKAKLKEYEEGEDKSSGNICVKNGNRNCDVYRTVEEAKAACREDRGYCSSPIEERESTIRFMLSDVKENSFNKITTTDDVENGKDVAK